MLRKKPPFFPSSHAGSLSSHGTSIKFFSPVSRKSPRGLEEEERGSFFLLDITHKFSFPPADVFSFLRLYLRREISRERAQEGDFLRLLLCGACVRAVAARLLLLLLPGCRGRRRLNLCVGGRGGGFQVPPGGRRRTGQPEQEGGRGAPFANGTALSLSLPPSLSLSSSAVRIGALLPRGRSGERRAAGTLFVCTHGAELRARESRPFFN